MSCYAGYVVFDGAESLLAKAVVMKRVIAEFIVNDKLRTISSASCGRYGAP